MLRYARLLLSACNSGRIVSARSISESLLGRRVFLTRLARSRRLLLSTFFGTGTVGLALTPFAKKKESSAHESSKLERIRREADILYNAYLIENAYNVLRRYAAGQDIQMLWRLARVLCEKAKLSQDKGEKKRHLYDAFAMAQKALENEGDQECFEAHKWYAIILSYVYAYEGGGERVKKSLEVRRHLEKALDLNLNDATTWHILGVWYFTYADLPMWKSVMAKTTLTTLPAATYEEALRCFEKAEFLSPNSYSSNIWYMAEVKSRMGLKEEAFKLYKAAFQMPVISMDDGDVHDKAYEKLRKLGVKNFDEF